MVGVFACHLHEPLATGKAWTDSRISLCGLPRRRSFLDSLLVPTEIRGRVKVIFCIGGGTTLNGHGHSLSERRLLSSS